MLPLALAASVLSPFIFRHKLIIAIRYWLGTLLHLVVALFVVIVTYGVVLLECVSSYRRGSPAVELYDAAGFVFATILAIHAGVLMAPKRLAGLVFPMVGGAAAFYPLCLYLHAGSSSQSGTRFVLYSAGCGIGTLIADRLLQLTWPAMIRRWSGIKTAMAGSASA